MGQRLFFSGHKRFHALKYQAIVVPDGIFAHFFGPLEGRRHDAGMLRESVLLEQLEQSMNRPGGGVYSLYGDPAYPLRQHLLCPFKGAFLTPDQQAFNTQMSGVRQCVEWVFKKSSLCMLLLIFQKTKTSYCNLLACTAQRQLF